MTTLRLILHAGALVILPVAPPTFADDSAPGPSPATGLPADPLADFLSLAARSAGAVPSTTSVGVPAPGYSERVSETCLFALKCATEIVGDRDAASRAFLIVSERLAEDGSYGDALAVIERIPDYRRLVAAVDLALRERIAGGGGGAEATGKGRHDWDGILERMVRNHSLSLTFREEGEVLLREAQWAAHRGKFDRVEALFSRLRNYPTLEYLARAEARVGVERARAGLDYGFERLVSVETIDPLIGRALPDFQAHIGRAQCEIALLEYDRATEASGRAKALARVRAALATAEGSRVFIGDLLVDACAELTRRGEADFAKAVFLERAPRIGELSNSASVKPLLLARLAPLYRQWAEAFDPEDLLDAAEGMAAKQHPVNRARALASIGAAWQALGHSERAQAHWEKCLALIGEIPGDPARLGTLAWLAVEVSWHHRALPESLREAFVAVGPKS